MPCMINDRRRTSSLYSAPSQSVWAWTSSLSCFINLIQAAKHTFGKISCLINGVTLELWKMSLLSMERRTVLFLSLLVSSDSSVDTHITHLWGRWAVGFAVRDTRLSLLCLWQSEYHIESHLVIYLLCCRERFHKIILTGHTSHFALLYCTTSAVMF